MKIKNQIRILTAAVLLLAGVAGAAAAADEQALPAKITFYVA
jgi:hypothetical protein